MASTSLTRVCIDGAQYDSGDLLGKALAHISLAPHVSIVVQATIVYSRR